MDSKTIIMDKITEYCPNLNADMVYDNITKDFPNSIQNLDCNEFMKYNLEKLIIDQETKALQEQIYKLQSNMLERLKKRQDNILDTKNEILDTGKTIKLVNDEKLEFDSSIVNTIIIDGSIPNIDTIISKCNNCRVIQAFNCDTLTRLPESKKLVTLKLFNCNNITGLHFQNWSHLESVMFKQCCKLLDHIFTRRWKSIRYIVVEDCERLSQIFINVPNWVEVSFK
jgi:hypothetical protein